MVKTENFVKVEVFSANDLRLWLTENHAQAESVWLVTFKKVVPNKYVSREAVLDELVCFGWTDGVRRKLDEQRTMQLISPRRTQHWARSYKERAAKLIREGRMHTAGLQSIEAGKASGLWNFMDDVDNLIVPADLTVALDKYPGAADFFHAINDSSKRFVLRWIKLAKTEKTRQKRLEQIALLSSKQEKLPGS